MNNGQITIKPYASERMKLLPPSLEELIPEYHLVRVVNRVVDELDINPLLAKYKGGGTSSNHPRMMLKVIVYAYTQKIYSSRKIEKALWENIGFMWIGGGNQPDFHTINNFRGETMKEAVRKVFASMMEFLVMEVICPAQNRMVYIETKPYKSKNDFLSERRVQECLTCSTCPFKSKCTITKGNRQMQVGFELRRYRKQAKDNLLSEQGIALRKRRSIEVETVFGVIKHNMNFRRFMLRGLKKVEIEWGLVCMAHNLRKRAVQ